MKTAILFLFLIFPVLFLQAQQTESNTQLSPGAALLFNNIKTKLSDAEKNEIFLSTGFIYNVSKKKLTPGEGVPDKNFIYDVLPADMNHDGIEEIFLYQSAPNGGMYHVYIKKGDKYQWCGMLDEYSDRLKVYDEKKLGYNIISAGVSAYSYQFDGSGYKLVNNAPRQQEDIPNDIFDFSRNYTNPLKTIANSDIVAAYLFRNVKTKLSNTEKRFFASGFAIQFREGDTSLVLIDNNKIIGIDEGGRVSIEVFPADLNHDGVEEIFMRTSGIFFGELEQDLIAYIKDKNGSYIAQDSINSPELYARATNYQGYPDLIASAPQGPAGMMDNLPTKFDVYRWNGTKYYVYKRNQPHLKTDKSIEGEINEAYQKTLPDSLLKSNVSFEIKKANEVLQQQTSSQKQNVSERNQNAIAEVPVSLSPVASVLFKNVETTMSDEEKNELAQLIGITEDELNAKMRSGNYKTVVNIYPVDFNNDNVDEIFLCITTKPLGIAMNTYFFFAKDYYGNYKPLPGKIGQGVRILLNGKTNYPDLITGTPGLNREVWNWNGNVYVYQQTIAGNVVIPYRTLDIDAASKQYSHKSIANGNNKLNVFDGEWHSNDYNYSFKISGTTGVATFSNSSNYNVGDIMLKIQSFDGSLYHGQQIYVDGHWHDVVLKKIDENTIWMQGGATWTMKRIK